MERILDVGCGIKKRSGAVGIDINPNSAADVLCDLDHFPYPFADSSFDRVQAIHVIEHVAEVLKTVEEFHRLVKPGGTIFLVTPHYTDFSSFCDPTHRWHLNSYSFRYFGANHGGYSYYSGARFRQTRVKLKLLQLWRYLGFEFLVNIWPRFRLFWEHYLCYVIRGKYIEFEFEVVKSAPSKDEQNASAIGPVTAELKPEFIRLAQKLFAHPPVICDIGSRDAREGISLMRLLNGKSLHVFEPNPSAAQVCRPTLADFGDAFLAGGDVCFNELAVSDEAGEIHFYPINIDLSENKDAGFSSLFRVNPSYTRRRGSIVQDEIVVNATTLDGYFQTKEPPDILWIDVEGAELKVLRGASRVLNNVRLLHLEVSFRPMQIGKPLFWDIFEHLTTCGFTFYGFTEVSALRGFLYRHRLLPNLPWRLNAIFYRK